jgi:hypothetical protein
MIVYSSRDLRSRRYQPYQTQAERRIKPGWFIVGGLVLLILMCCCCSFLGLAWQQGWFSKLPSLPSLPALPGASKTTAASSTKVPAGATPDPDKPVPMQTRSVGDNGLEVTVLNLQRPLRVEGLKALPPDQQFVLVTVRVRNTKSTGTPIPINGTDFTMTGDGGLTYNPNPKNITIQNLLTQATVPPGKELAAELIFQIAVNDANLRMTWNAGGSTRTFIIEEVK